MNLYRNEFPIFEQTMRGKPLVYLDSSATSQKPRCVLEAIQNFYLTTNANIHRGVYEMSERATALFELTRKNIKEFINAKHTHEIIFVRGATEAINLVAHSFGRMKIVPNDEVLITAMEHHSNIVPWQMMCEQLGANLKVIPISDTGEIDLEVFHQQLTPKTKIVAISHASNVLGTINPIKEMIRIAHRHDIPVLVDGAQAFPHLAVDVQDLDCDFYVFSAHKAYGPTGLGVLYGKTNLLESMPPYQGGGYMIENVTFEKSTYNKLPFKFEAGTSNIASVIGFNAALDFLKKITFEKIRLHENELLKYLNHKIIEFPEIKIFGEAKEKLGVFSFTMSNAHPHDVGTVLDHEGVAVRVGHHCAMPLMNRFKVPAMIRVSFGIYNTFEDIDILIKSLHEVKRLFPNE